MPTKAKRVHQKKSARKPQPKSKAKKTAKPSVNSKAKPALAKPPAVIEKREPEIALTKSFVARAEAWDAEIRAGIHDVGVKWTKLGQKAQDGRERGYFKAIRDTRKEIDGKHGKEPNPRFGKPFARFDEWATATFEKASSTIFRAMSLVKQLTTGPNALTADELSTIPKNNAERLAKIPASKRTPAVVAAAKTMHSADFQQHVEMPLTGSTEQPTVQFSKMLPREVYEELLEAIEIGKYIARDDDREMGLEAKAIQAIAREFKSTYQNEYEEYVVLRDEKQRAQDRVNEADPDYAGSSADEMDEISRFDLEEEEEEEEEEEHSPRH